MTSTKLSPKDKSNKSKSAHNQDSIPSFIRKTYDILEEHKFPEIIDWNPEGTALVIKKPSDFCQKVLPAYFKHNNLTSFVRQLNMYNFHKRRTQNIDHVYYHELFQKGKKNLLKEIKRKNHELAEKSVKSPESSEASSSQKDLPALCYENQILKRLYNDAMSKVSILENQVKELGVQNQTLWSQLYAESRSTSQSSAVNVKPFLSQSELTADQLPMTFGDISIPPLQLRNVEQRATIQGPVPALKTNVNGFFSTKTEESGESTEVSHNSPNAGTAMESEKNYDMTEATPLTSSTEGTYNLPTLNLTPQVSQALQIQNNRSFGDLFASRGDMSMGQLFETWNAELTKNNNGVETNCFTEPKEILGKRPLDTENVSALFQVPEPIAKRNESISALFASKGFISTGTEDKEFFRNLLGRNISNGEGDLDLMDFNLAGFCGWTKAA